MSLAVRMIRSLDFFSATPIWYVRGNPSSTSTSGIFFTIILLGFLIWAGVYLTSDLVNHENSKVTDNNLLGVGSDYTYNIRDPEFSYVFGMINYETNEFYVDPSIFSIKGVLYENDGNVKELEFVKCNETDIKNYFPHTGDLLCFDPKQKDLTISGINSYMEIDVVLCENSTANGNSCASQEVFDTIFERKDELYVFFPIHSVLTRNFTTPIIKSWNYQDFYLDKTLTKRVSLVMKKILLITDTGLLTSSESVLNMTSHEEFFSDIGYRKPGTVFTIEIFTNGNMDYIVRKYPKIQEILGQFIGLTHALLFILTLLVVPFTRMKMYQYLGAEAFHLSMERKERLGKRFEKKFIPPEVEPEVQHQKPNSLHVAFDDNVKTPSSDHPTNPENFVTSPREGLLNQLTTESPMKRQDTSIVQDYDNMYVTENENGENELGVESLHFSKEFDLKSEQSPRHQSMQMKMGEVGSQNELNEEETAGKDLGALGKDPDTQPAGVRQRIRKRGCCRRRAKEKMIDITYLEWLFSGIKKTPQIILAEKMREEICSRLDVKTVIRKFLEIDLLKNILLTQNQLIIFENVCKPKIKMDYCRDVKKNFTFEYKTEKILENYHGKKHLLEEAYHQLKTKENKSKIDIELLERYHKKLKRGKKMQTQVVLESWRDI